MNSFERIFVFIWCLTLSKLATQQLHQPPPQVMQSIPPPSQQKQHDHGARLFGQSTVAPQKVDKQLETIIIQIFEEDLSKTELFDCSQYLRYESTRKNTLKIWTKNCDKYFALNNENNKLILVKEIDRESICLSSLLFECKISMTLTCKSAFESYNIPLIVNVLDINDNTPHFRDLTISLKISESTQPGEFFHIQPATDADVGNNSMITYTLHPSNSNFQLNVLEDSFGNVIDLKLELVASLDREKIDSYHFRIIATDQGFPRKSAELNVSVDVLDENDNQPKFEQTSYLVEMKSDDPVGHLVVKVKAVDMDEGDNGKVVYSFNKKTLEIFGKLFSINSDSGEIKLISKLSDDPSLTPPFVLIVAATDSGSDQFPVIVQVQIKVLNTNAHVPVITLVSNFLGNDKSNLIVEENNVVNFHVADVEVHDDDHGTDGMVDCKIKDTDFLRLLRTIDNKFQLIILGQMDREKEGRHTATIWCEDLGDEPKSTLLQVNIIVTDLDDNPPVFSKHIYVASLYENNQLNSKITQLQISDSDVDIENTIANFYVEPHFEHLFTVDRDGNLLALVSFDREVNDQYTFHVFAKSGNIYKENSTATHKHVTKTLVNLTIIDLDDEVAKFDQPWFNFNISENQAIGTFVGQVKAFDADLPPFNFIEYSLFPTTQNKFEGSKYKNSIKQQQQNLYNKQFQQQQQNLDFPFFLDSSTGNIITKKSLDREERSHYEFKVYVKEESASVFIDVLDVNDNSPEWIHPKSDNCLKPDELRLKGNLTFARQLTTVVATDKDLNDNAKIVYSIISGNDFNQFSVDANTGVLSWNSYLSGLSTPKQCQTRLKFKAQNIGQSNSNSEITCLDVIFEDCLSYMMNLKEQEAAKYTTNVNKDNNKSFFLDNYLLILIIVLVSCIIITIVLTTAICVTRRQTRAMKKERFRQNDDLRASIPLAGPDGEAVLVLDRSSTHESTDQLTGILVSLKRAEQLGGRLQLRSLAPSRDSLMSASTIICREKDADSGYADVSSPV